MEKNQSVNYSKIINQPGSETFPIRYKGEYYVFQCKFFEDGKLNSGAIIESIKTFVEKSKFPRFKSYKDASYYVIYTNAELDATSKKIDDMLIGNGLKPIWINGQFLLDKLRLEQSGLAKCYFDPGYISPSESATSYADYHHKVMDGWEVHTSNHDNGFLNLPLKKIFVEQEFSDSKKTKIKVSGILEINGNEGITLLRGNPGIGKSTVCDYLTYRYGALEKNHWICKVPLKDPRAISFVKELVESQSVDVLGILARKFNNETTTDLGFVSSGVRPRLTVIFDGLDELHIVSGKDGMDLSHELFHHIKTHLTKIRKHAKDGNVLGNDVSFIFTTRPSMTYAHENPYEVMPFNGIQGEEFKAKLINAFGDNRHAAEIVRETFRQNNLIDKISCGETILNEPLILNIFINTCLRRGEPWGLSESGHAEFFGEFFKEYYRLQAQKLTRNPMMHVYESEKLDSLAMEVALRISKDGGLSATLNKDFISETEKLHGLCLIHVKADSNEIEFIHRSFLDYYVYRNLKSSMESPTDQRVNQISSSCKIGFEVIDFLYENIDHSVVTEQGIQKIIAPARETISEMQLTNLINIACAFDPTMLRRVFNGEFGKHFSGLYIRGTNAANSTISGVSFENCHFFKIEWGESEIKSTNFINCLLRSIDFGRTTLEETKFSRCNINNVQFEYIKISGCSFIESTFTNTSFVSGKFSKTVFENCFLLNVIGTFSNIRTAYKRFKGTNADQSCRGIGYEND